LTKQLDLLVDALRLHQQAAKVMPVPVPLVLIRLHRDHEELASRKGLTLRIRPTGVAVMSDPVLLEVTLRNLVRNALKYTRPGGQVLVGCRRRGSRVRIESMIPVSGFPQTRLQECSMPFIDWIRARQTAWALACSSFGGRSTSWATALRFARPSATGHTSRSWPKLRLRSSREAMRWKFQADR
jgi:hypothetical protein